LLLERNWVHVNCCIPSTLHQVLLRWKGDVRVLYLGYRESLVTAQKPLYDWLPPAVNGWETKHPISDKVPLVLDEEEEPPT
jgi:hypothetical protein